MGCHSLLQGSSQPRDQARVSCTAGRPFTVWATREAHSFLLCPKRYGGGAVAKSCPTPETPWTIARQAPLSRGSPRQEYQSGNRVFPTRDRTWVSRTAGSLFTNRNTGKPQTLYLRSTWHWYTEVRFWHQSLLTCKCLGRFGNGYNSYGTEESHITNYFALNSR